jgi:hypothetical protein
MRVLRDVKTPAVSKLIEQRKGYARKRRDGQASASSSKTVHDTCEVEVMHTLHEALRRYDDGVRAGLELHDRKTVSPLRAHVVSRPDRPSRPPRQAARLCPST